VRVAELPGIGQPLRLAERPLPEPGPGEVRVRVQACGVCGSDLFLQDGGFEGRRSGGRNVFPIVPGHEAAGVVDAVAVDAGDVKVGAQVAIYYVDPQPDGPFAQAGRENLDPGVTRMGVDIDGAFAEYVIRPWHTLIAAPKPMDPGALAVLTDAVATPYHGLVRRAQLQTGETLVVLGVGGLGSSAVQIGKHCGARVIAVSRQQSKLDLALSLGADEVIVAGDDVVAQIAALTDGGADVVIQCAGSGALDAQAVALAGRGGRVVFVGVSMEPFEVVASDLIWRELSLLASCRFTKQDIRESIDLYLAGAITVEHLLTQRRPLEEANEALDDLRRGRVIRSVIVP
jgi:2-desacetyl-2-hydroxyethyl bacteriochlorophyllide A dehydrogenase